MVRGRVGNKGVCMLSPSPMFCTLHLHLATFALPTIGSGTLSSHRAAPCAAHRPGRDALLRPTLLANPVARWRRRRRPRPSRPRRSRREPRVCARGPPRSRARLLAPPPRARQHAAVRRSPRRVAHTDVVCRFLGQLLPMSPCFQCVICSCFDVPMLRWGYPFDNFD